MNRSGPPTHVIGSTPPLSEIDHHVGNRVRQWREARGIDEALLASKLGITVEILQSKEKGCRRFRVVDLREVCRVLVVRPRDLFSDDAVTTTAPRLIS